MTVKYGRCLLLQHCWRPVMVIACKFLLLHLYFKHGRCLILRLHSLPSMADAKSYTSTDCQAWPMLTPTPTLIAKHGRCLILHLSDRQAWPMLKLKLHWLLSMSDASDELHLHWLPSIANAYSYTSSNLHSRILQPFSLWLAIGHCYLLSALSSLVMLTWENVYKSVISHYILCM